MNLVVAVDQNWAIGKNGQLLVHNDYDLEHFKAITTGKTIVYGRKTLETFPGGKPLKNRTNLVLTRDENFAVEGATIIHDLSELDKYDSSDLYVIGGASIYEQLYDKCQLAFVTHFEFAAENPDAFFPNLAEKANWIKVEETPVVTVANDCKKNRNSDGPKVAMRFVTYRNTDTFPLDDVD